MIFCAPAWTESELAPCSTGRIFHSELTWFQVACATGIIDGNVYERSQAVKCDVLYSTIQAPMVVATGRGSSPLDRGTVALQLEVREADRILYYTTCNRVAPGSHSSSSFP